MEAAGNSKRLNYIIAFILVPTLSRIGGIRVGLFVKLLQKSYCFILSKLPLTWVRVGRWLPEVGGAI